MEEGSIHSKVSAYMLIHTKSNVRWTSVANYSNLQDIWGGKIGNGNIIYNISIKIFNWYVLRMVRSTMTFRSCFSFPSSLGQSPNVISEGNTERALSVFNWLKYHGQETSFISSINAYWDELRSFNLSKTATYHCAFYILLLLPHFERTKLYCVCLWRQNIKYGTISIREKLTDGKILHQSHVCIL